MMKGWEIEAADHCERLSWSQAQIRIADGLTLEEAGVPPQDKIKVNGFAIQCRVTTEDAMRNFQPDFGKIEAYRAPGGPGIRLDGGQPTGGSISPHYDSLLVKVTARGQDFRAAVQKMYRALEEFRRGAHFLSLLQPPLR